MSKARSILKMYTEGVSKKSISVRTGATRNTVKKYIRQFILMGKRHLRKSISSVIHSWKNFFLPHIRKTMLISAEQTLLLSFLKLKKRSNAKVRLGKSYGGNIFRNIRMVIVLRSLRNIITCGARKLTLRCTRSIKVVTRCMSIIPAISFPLLIRQQVK